MFEFVSEWGEKLFTFSILSALMYTLVVVGVANAGLISAGDSLPPAAVWVNWFIQNNVNTVAASNEVFQNFSVINVLMTLFAFLYNLLTWILQLAQFASDLLAQFGLPWAGWVVTVFAAFAQFIANYYVAWRLFLFVKTIIAQVSIMI